MFYCFTVPTWNKVFLLLLLLLLSSLMLVFRHSISKKHAHISVVTIYSGITSLALGWSSVCPVPVTRRQIILVNISHSKTMCMFYGIWWASAIMIPICCNFPALEIRTVGLSCRLSPFIPTFSGISPLKPLSHGSCRSDLIDMCFKDNLS